LSGLRVRGRVVRFTATKGAKVVVRGRGLRRVLHVRACRAYRITLRVRAGARVTVTASSAAHAEHRAVRARRA
ncbi:MAG: hypothetical protein HZB46_04410, partial [Solirubrobacterales bacterium]|nr:hypothetical protein [Solirubrobacterales bacterium]